MQSRWNDQEAARWAASTPAAPDLGLRVYTSRLLGAERTLVLHGGGNTSVKVALPDAIGASEQVLLVKGSGSDLAQVKPEHFSAVRLNAARRLLDLEELDNDGLAHAVSTMLARAPSPKASIETLLHASLPFAFVEHTHADAVLAIANTRNGEHIARELFGDLAPLVPFRHSGFALAKACAQVYREQATDRSIGLILLHHGVVAFGHSAQASYENMLQLVSRAEDYLAAHAAWELPRDETPFTQIDPPRIAKLRREVSHAAGFPLLMQRLEDAHWRAYARRADLAALSAQGPATPQHAVFIKREPLLGSDVSGYAQRYASYVAAAYPGKTPADLGLDPAPRVLIDPALGVWVAGINPHYLEMSAEILTQDREIKTRAAGHDHYAGLPPAAILEAEIHYGGFERRLREGATEHSALLGEAALLVGNHRHIAHVAAALAQCGAAVTVQRALHDAELRDLVGNFGGLDVLLLIDANEDCIDHCAELLALAPRGGRIVAVEVDSKGLAQRASARALAHRLPLVRVHARREGAFTAPQLALIARLCDPELARSCPAVTLENNFD